MTFYTKYGDVFVLLCGIVVLATLIAAMWQWREKKEEGDDLQSVQLLEINGRGGGGGYLCAYKASTSLGFRENE